MGVVFRDGRAARRCVHARSLGCWTSSPRNGISVPPPVATAAASFSVLRSTLRSSRSLAFFSGELRTFFGFPPVTLLRATSGIGPGATPSRVSARSSEGSMWPGATIPRPASSSLT